MYSHREFLSAKPIRIEIPKNYKVSGYVVDEQGQPLANVRVNSRWYTDAQGRFELKLPKPLSPDQLRFSFWRRDLVGLNQKVDWEVALTDELRFQMHSQASLTVAGQARFLNGQPVANARLVFYLTRPNEDDSGEDRNTQVQAKTDKDGNFGVVLPGTGSFHAKVNAEQDSGSGAAKMWSCAVGQIKMGQAPLKLRFDNRGRIIVRIFHGGQLESQQQVVVSCYSLASKRNVVWQRVSADDRGIVLDNLEPGDYRVTARVEDKNHLQFETMVNVPHVDPCRVVAAIKIPVPQYGTVVGRVLKRDGINPAADASVAIHSAGTSQTIQTDEQGKFVAEKVLAGEVWYTLAADNHQGLFKTRRIALNSGEHVDVGDLRLSQTEKIGQGKIRGRLFYADGADVQGQTLLGVLPMESPFLSAFSDILPLGNGGAAEGELSAPAGRCMAIFEHHGTAKPRNFLSGSMDFPPDFRRYLFVPVDIQADKTTICERVIPRRAEGRDLKVLWTGSYRPRITVVIPHSQQDYWIYESQAARFVMIRDANGEILPEQEQFVFRDIAAGPGHLIFDAWGSGVITVLPLPPPGVEEIHIDESQVGSLTVEVFDAKGKPLAATLTLSVALGEMLSEKTILVFNPEQTKFLNGSLASMHDGRMVISGLGPAEYRLQINAGGSDCKLSLHLKPSERRHIRLQVNDQGTLALVNKALADAP